jgi:hypothetical protein
LPAHPLCDGVAEKLHDPRLRARTFAEMLEVQAKLLRDNMQSFIDQSARIAEAAGRMATRPFNALKETRGE